MTIKPLHSELNALRILQHITQERRRPCFWRQLWGLVLSCPRPMLAPCTRTSQEIIYPLIIARAKLIIPYILIAKFALATQDFDITQDLGILNGRPHKKTFDVFWSEIKSLLEGHARTDDRRHGISAFSCMNWFFSKCGCKCYLCSSRVILCFVCRWCWFSTGRDACSRITWANSGETHEYTSRRTRNNRYIYPIW